MRESTGKAVARQHFYRVCLPQWLSQEQLRSGSYLLLLGEEPREIPLLDELGVPRERTWSVERSHEIYNRQVDQNLGVSLYCGQMADYLLAMLHGNQRFGVFNLDIEGSYFNGLDPAMGSVLLFCWRNPDTVVATYSSIGRDASTLWEGVRALTLFFACAGSSTLEFLATMSGRYAAAKFTEPLNMALRDCCWINSVFQHSLTSSVVVGLTPAEHAYELRRRMDELWQRLLQQHRHVLQLWDLVRVCSEGQGQRGSESRLGVRVAAMANLVYNAEPPWSQRCWFTKFSSGKPVSVREWLTEVFGHFCCSPLRFVDHEGQKHEYAQMGSVIAPETVLWQGPELWQRFCPRRYALPDRRLMQAAGKTLHVIAERQEVVEQPSEAELPATRGEEVNAMALQFIRNGELTPEGKEKIKAHAARGLSTAEIQKLVPRSVPERVIRAYVAVAHRGRRR